jgi:predicted metal-binding membrane protein
MTLLLVTGVMDVGAIAVVAVAITVERLTPRPERTVRVAGVLVIAAGALVIVRALGVA